MIDDATPAAAPPRPDEETPPWVTGPTLAAWRAGLASLREQERQEFRQMPAETGRLLEIVGQALAQGGGPLPAADIIRIETLTHVSGATGETALR